MRSNPPSVVLACIVELMAAFSFVHSDSLGQDCVKCGKRVVYCYDIAVNTAAPMTHVDSVRWRNLHFVSVGYRAKYVNFEDKNCLEFIYKFRSDYDTPWIDPDCQGAENVSEGAVDYQMYGGLSGTEGNYTATLHLLNNKRMSIASASYRFENSNEPLWVGNMLALNLGETAKGSRSLTEIIKEYEVKTRNESNKEKFGRIALNPTLTFADYSYKVEAKKSKEIRLSLVDCDGVPLKNRKISLATDKGELESEEVFTDESGVARVTFTAPPEDGVAELKAWWDFYYPSEKLGHGCADRTIITIGSSSTLPERFVMTFYQKFHDKAMDNQYESTVNVTYVRTKRSAKAYSNIANTLEAAGQVDYQIESISGTGKGWNPTDKVWVQGHVDEKQIGKVGATIKPTAGGMLLTADFLDVSEDSPEYMYTFDFVWDFSWITFTPAESNQLDMLEKVKRIRVPQDIKPTNVDDCTGEFVLTFKGIQKESIDIKLKQLNKGKAKRSDKESVDIKLKQLPQKK